MKVDKEKLIESYARNKGNVSKTCREIGISRQTFYRIKGNNEEVRQGLIEGYEAILDKAEDKLQEFIDEGNLTALIFFLKTKGKKRGYNERKEIDKLDRNIKISYVKNKKND